MARASWAYVEEVLVPTLRPGDVAVMDNLGSHKGKAVRAAIRRAAANLFFLPPYSSDLKPIEQVFVKLKLCCAKPPSEPSKPLGDASASCSSTSHHRSAQTTSGMLDTLQLESEKL